MEKRISYFSVIGLLIILCLLLCFIFITDVSVAEAEDYLDVYDEVFIDTVMNLGIGNNGIEYTRISIYDIDAKFLGFVFDYKSDKDIGYAVLIHTENGIKITELCPGCTDPYENLQGMPVYVCEFNYWGKVGDQFISSTGIKLNSSDMKSIFTNRYGSMIDEFIKSKKTIRYFNKSESYFNLADRIPNYTYTKIDNACIPIAAGNIVAYFDRYCTNLIANYTPGVGLGSLYRYSHQNSNIETMIEQLCIDMSTNVAAAGNSIAEFKSGLDKYCSRAGYTVSYTTCMDGKSFDYEKAKGSIQFDKTPIIMFVNELEFNTINEISGADSYDVIYVKDTHALSAFGYKEITYNMQAGTTNVSRFLYVATGISKPNEAYLNVDNNLGLDDAYCVNIA